MKLLVDTHCLLWAMMTPAQLSDQVRSLLLDPGNELVVSAACAWEISTKFRLGKLPEARSVMQDYAGALSRLQAVELPITGSHALLAGNFPQPHRDPFDRILAAQAILERMPLITRDSAFAAFPVSVLW